MSTNQYRGEKVPHNRSFSIKYQQERDNLLSDIFEHDDLAVVHCRGHQKENHGAGEMVE